MILVALLKQEKDSRVIEHKNQQRHISFVDNRIAVMQRRSNMLSIVQRHLAYSEKYCDNINGVEQKQRVFSSWNILINNKPSSLSQAMILVMNHVMEVINNHIKKILNALT